MGNKKYHDKQWLQREYVDKRRTTTELAEDCGVTATTISDWLHRHEIGTRDQSEAQQAQGKHTDESWLRQQYVDERRSMADIGDECDVTAATIMKWLDKYDIPKRNSTDHIRRGGNALIYEKGLFGGAPGAYVKYQSSRKIDGQRRFYTVYIHQLLAIAEGADPHKVFSDGAYHCHHKNGLRWDNRPSNVELKKVEQHIGDHVQERERTETGEWV